MENIKINSSDEDSGREMIDDISSTEGVNLSGTNWR